MNATIEDAVFFFVMVAAGGLVVVCGLVWSIPLVARFVAKRLARRGGSPDGPSKAVRPSAPKAAKSKSIAPADDASPRRHFDVASRGVHESSGRTVRVE